MTRDRTDVPNKRLFRLDEAAAVLTVSYSTVQRMVRDGALEVIQVSPRLRRVPRDALVRVLDARS